MHKILLKLHVTPDFNFKQNMYHVLIPPREKPLDRPHVPEGRQSIIEVAALFLTLIVRIHIRVDSHGAGGAG